MADTDQGSDESQRRSGSTGRRPSAKAAKAPAGAHHGAHRDEHHDEHHDGGGHHPHPRISGRRAARLAALELAELTGKEFEGIVGIRRVDGEWHVEVEVLEMQRIPSTTDVLAVYEVSLDASGELVGYERTARYVRGDAGEDRG
jgi:hypothetical protein